MKSVVIGVAGPADRLVAAGLHQLKPVLEKLGPSVLIIGGLMVRIWLHERPLGLPARATPDIDLGVDRQRLRLTGDTRVVGPLLESRGFESGYGGEPFRYSKEIEGLGEMIVDVVVAPGASRNTPPLLEGNVETVAAPGLAYALLRGPLLFETRFVDGQQAVSSSLHLPRLDAAFVLKAALAESGVRTRPDRVITDSVDAIMLAAACLTDPPSLQALRDYRGRSDVRKALRWVDEAFRSNTAVGSRRAERHFEDEGAGTGAGEWAHRVAVSLAEAITESLPD